MTSELEQEFFSVFGVEPEYNDGCKLADNYWYNDFLRSQYDTLDEYLAFNCPYQNDRCLSTCDFAYDDKQYPEITDRILLELICIVGTVIRHFKIPPKLKLEQLKYHILRNCINEQDEIYIKIQQLFKEDEWK